MKVRQIFNKDILLKGTVWKSIFIFSIPLIIGNFAQQLYSAVDAIVIGKYVGDKALAAIGSTLPLTFFFVMLFVGISSGVSIMVSQYFGAKDSEALSYTIGNCITFTAIASIVIILSGIFLPEIILRAINVPENIVKDAALYLRILLIGSPAIGYYNIFAGIIRGLGDSLTALFYLLIASIINIILDIIFVVYFNLSVEGVAIATIISQTISAILCINKILNMKDYYIIKKKHLKLNTKYIKKISKLGIPSGLLQAIISISNILVQSLANQFGDFFITANLIVIRVDRFTMLPNFSFGIAMSAFTGQNIGAKNYNRVKKGIKQGIILIVIISTILTISILIFGKSIMGLFTDTKSIIDFAYSLMLIIAPAYVLFGCTQIFLGVMRGSGDTLTPLLIHISTTFFFRFPLAYIIAHFTKTESMPNGSHYSTYISLLATWILTFIITFIVFKRRKWTDSKIID